MNHYYLNRDTMGNPNHNHEVHKSTCRYLPSALNRVYLGYFSSCAEAMKVAKLYYNNVDACVFCCPECHHE